jgi:hypothetical protein
MIEQAAEVDASKMTASCTFATEVIKMVHSRRAEHWRFL